MRIGIVGAGMTVPWFLEAAKLIPEMEVWALYVRKEEKRQELCEKYQVPVAYDSYEKLLADASLMRCIFRFPTICITASQSRLWRQASM